MRSPQRLQQLCLKAMASVSTAVALEGVSQKAQEAHRGETAPPPARIHPSLRRPIAADKAVRLFPVFLEYEMEQEQNRCLDAMLKELMEREIGEHDLKSAAFHRACVEVACVFKVPELYSACVDVAIDNPATHFDALIHNLEKTRLEDLLVFASKLKRSAYEHRNQRPFVSRFHRPCEAFCSAEAGVEYIHLANGGKVPFGF